MRPRPCISGQTGKRLPTTWKIVAADSDEGGEGAGIAVVGTGGDWAPRHLALSSGLRPSRGAAGAPRPHRGCGTFWLVCF